MPQVFSVSASTPETKLAHVVAQRCLAPATFCGATCCLHRLHRARESQDDARIDAEQHPDDDQDDHPDTATDDAAAAIDMPRRSSTFELWSSVRMLAPACQMREQA